MKYFLPELYVQLNSPDVALADAAEEAIDRAAERYNRRWEEIKSRLPSQVVQFYEEQDLHDADVLAPAKISDSGSPWKTGDVVLVAQQMRTAIEESLNALLFLHYAIVEEPQVRIPICSEVFSEVQRTWLYDEFDIEGSGVYTHSILVSDGRVLKIFFREFDYRLARIVAPEFPKTRESETACREGNALKI